MNHVLEEILRDWAAKDAHIKALQAECEELKHEIAAKNKAIGELKHELVSLRDGYEAARRKKGPQAEAPAVADNKYHVVQLAEEIQEALSGYRHGRGS